MEQYDESEMAGLIFRAACLQCGTTPEQWMMSEQLRQAVAERVGTMSRKWLELTEEQQKIGKEAIEVYLAKAGR